MIFVKAEEEKQQKLWFIFVVQLGFMGIAVGL